MTEDNPSAEMARHAQAAAEMVLANFGYELDFSEPTIGTVESLLSALWQQGDRDLFPQAALLFGAYLGEVVRCCHPQATWMAGSLTPDGPSPPLVIEDITLYPLSWCFKRLHNGPDDSVVEKYMAFREALAERGLLGDRTDSTPAGGAQTARDQEDGSLLRLATEWLAGKLISRGLELVPMAVTLSPQGEVKGVLVQPVAGGGGVYQQLLAALRQAVGRGRFIGVAVCALGEVTEPGAGRPMRALIVDIEHVRLAPRTWIWPFEKVGDEHRFGGATGEGYVRPGASQVFDAPDQPAEFSYTGPFGPLIETFPVAPADVARLRARAQGKH
jgi:hypothetical protein